MTAARPRFFVRYAITAHRVAVMFALPFAIAACDAAQPPIVDDLGHPDYQVLADELIKERPTIITVDLLRDKLDSATLTRIESSVSQLNDALSRLAVLHQIDDTATSRELRSRLNVLAIPFQLIADRSNQFVLTELAGSQRIWFHEFLEQRAQAAGLPHEVWRVEPPAINELRGVQHRSAAPHDTSRTPRR